MRIVVWPGASEWRGVQRPQRTSDDGSLLEMIRTHDVGISVGRDRADQNGGRWRGTDFITDGSARGGWGVRDSSRRAVAERWRQAVKKLGRGPPKCHE